MNIIETRDADGDKLTFSETDNPNDGAVFVKTSAYHGAFLTREDVTRLCAALEPYGAVPTLKIGGKATVTGDSARWAHEFEPGTVVTLQSEAKDGGRRCEDESGTSWYVHTSDLRPEGTSTFSPKVGDVCRLLPDSRYANGNQTVFDPDVTLVKITVGLDTHGDYTAEALDGGDRGDEYGVGPASLAPLTGGLTLPPFVFDAQRLAALEKARELIADLPDESQGETLVRVAAFLLDELSL